MIICSIGAAQSLFWSIYLLRFEKRSISTRILAGFFFALAVRIIKSTLWLFTADVDIIILNIGFSAHLAIGPFLLLYFQTLQKSFQLKWQHGLHYIPVVVVLALSTQLQLNSFWYVGGYTLLAVQSIVYLFIAGIWLFKNEKSMGTKERNWAILLLLGTGVVLVAYFTNYISGPLFYADFFLNERAIDVESCVGHLW